MLHDGGKGAAALASRNSRATGLLCRLCRSFRCAHDEHGGRKRAIATMLSNAFTERAHKMAGRARFGMLEEDVLELIHLSRDVGHDLRAFAELQRSRRGGGLKAALLDRILALEREKVAAAAAAEEDRSAAKARIGELEARNAKLEQYNITAEDAAGSGALAELGAAMSKRVADFSSGVRVAWTEEEEAAREQAKCQMEASGKETTIEGMMLTPRAEQRQEEQDSAKKKKRRRRKKKGKRARKSPRSKGVDKRIIEEEGGGEATAAAAAAAVFPPAAKTPSRPRTAKARNSAVKKQERKYVAAATREATARAAAAIKAAHNLTQEELAQKIEKTREEINAIENSRLRWSE